MPIFHKLVWLFKVFVKCLQYTLVKIPQWSCKTTFLPCQNSCSQKPVSVHVSLNANELLPTPPLCILCGEQPSKTKRIHCVLSGSDVRRKWKLLCSLLHPTTKRLHCSVERYAQLSYRPIASLWDRGYTILLCKLLSFIAGKWTNSSVKLKEA